MSDIKFFILTYRQLASGDPHKAFDRARAKARDYKAIAGIAAKIITTPANYTFESDTTPIWSDEAMLTVYDDLGYQLAEMRTDGHVLYAAEIPTTALYGAVMYIVTAIRNAVAKVREVGQTWLSLTEVEATLGLKAGVVRKHINDKQTMLLETGVIRRADQRTWLMKQGYALWFWGKRGDRVPKDVAGPVSDNGELVNDLYQQLAALQYVDDVPGAFRSRAKTPPVQVRDFMAQIERVNIGPDVVVYNVITWGLGTGFRDYDLTVLPDGPAMWSWFRSQNIGGAYGRKIQALAAFGIKEQN